MKSFSFIDKLSLVPSAWLIVAASGITYYNTKNPLYLVPAIGLPVYGYLSNKAFFDMLEEIEH